MANLIKIKRSSATATPTSLNEGELAFSYLSGKLYIGNSSAVIPIGGTHSPGVLTANQALVANATSEIDKIIVANLNIKEVWANGAVGTAGYILGSGGTGANAYWIDPSTLQTAVGGVNTNIQFNDEGDLGGSNAFVWNKTTDVLTIGNSTVNVAVNSSHVTVASQVSVGTNTTITSGTLTLGNSTVNTFANSSTVDVGKTGTLVGHRFLSSNISLQAPNNGNYAGERLRLYDFGDSRVHYSMGVEGGHIWTAVDNSSNTIGFKWYGNTVLAARLGGTGTLEIKSDFYTDASVNANVSVKVGANVVANTSALLIGNSTVNTVIDSLSVTTDKVTVANLVPTKIHANGAFGTTGQVLLSNSTGGVYWGAATQSIDDLTDVTISSAANNNLLVYDAAAGQWENHSVTGTANQVDVDFAGQDITVKLANDVVIANSVSIGNSTVNVSANSTVLSIGVVAVNSEAIFVGNSTVNTTIKAGNIALQGTQITLGANVTLDAERLFIGNSTVNTVVNSSSISTSGSVQFKDLSVSNSVTITNALTVNGNVILGADVQLGNSFGVDTVSFLATVNTEISPSSNNNYKLGRADLRWGEVNANNILATNANTVDLSVTGNTKLGDASSDVVSFVATVNTNIVPSANMTYSLGNNSLYWAEVHTGNVHADYGYFQHDVAIYGDLTVAGNLVTTNVQSVVISDPLIYLAGNNYTSDLVDIGFVGNYHTGGANLHTGLFRDASVDQYYLFKGLTQELDGVLTVNTADPTFALADLNAWLLSGALVSNSTGVTITANSTYSVDITANTVTTANLVLTTPLAVSSGGTGANTFTQYGVLFGDGTNPLQVTAAGTAGQVLQANSTGGPVFADLDGGTF